jgi:hypothetical protein
MRVLFHHCQECVQRLGALFCPVEHLSLFQKGCEWCSNMCIVRDEWSLVSKHTKCAADLLHSGQSSGPLSEPLSLHWVDVYNASLYTNAQVINTRLLKLALGQLEEEGFLSEHLEDFLHNFPVPLRSSPVAIRTSSI